MRGRWKYESYKRPFAKSATWFVLKIVIIAVIVLVAVFCIGHFFVPFISDIMSDRDPAERYKKSVTVSFQHNTNNNNEYDGIEIFDGDIYEIKSNYTMKSDPFYDDNRIIFSTDSDISSGVFLDSICVYDTDTSEVTKIENINKKYDNLLMTKMSGNYAVWIDSMIDGGGRICGYDFSTGTQFTIKEYGYAIPEISINGDYIAFMQVAGESEQRIYLYNLASRVSVAVKVYENTDVTCSNVSLSDSQLVWSEYSGDGKAILKVLDLDSGNGSYKEINLGDYVFEPKTNGKYILYSTKLNSLEGDLMLSYDGESPVKVASNVLDYSISDDYAVYSKDEKIYGLALDRALQPQLISGEFIRALFASFNKNHLCFYDVTDDFGLIDSVRYLNLGSGK